MTKSTITRERLQEIAEDGFLKHGESKELARMALAAMDSEPVRNPVLSYADSYRDMAKQGAESVPIWSVITDLERNIAPLYRHAQQPVVPDAYVRDERGRMMLNGVCEPKIGFGAGWNTCRATMLQAGNSQLIPEGYVLVPKEPTKEMIDAGWLHYMGTKNPSSKGTYKAMLAAAPQEVKGE